MVIKKNKLFKCKSIKYLWSDWIVKNLIFLLMYVKKYIILMGKCIGKQMNEGYINELINETIDLLLNNG